MKLWLTIAAAVLVLGAASFALRALWRFVREDLTQIGDLLWRVWCISILIRWRLKARLRTKYLRTALGVALAGGIWVFLHAAHALTNHLAGGTQHGGTEAGTGMLDIFPGVAAPPWWFESILVALSGLIVWHHVHEWRLREREMILPREVGGLLTDCRTFIGRPNSLTSTEKDTFFETTMTRVNNALNVGRKTDIAISLMALYGTPTALRVRYVFPSGTTLIDRDCVLPEGKGAAGKALADGTVYIPSVKHRGGINTATEKSVGLVYEKSEKEPMLKGSLICAQVVSGKRAGAVLCVWTPKQDAFPPLDIDIVRLAATVLSEVDWQN